MNWGKGIGIFLALFIVFISTLAYFLMQANADLVSEDYYLKEVNYGNEIEAHKNAKEVGAKIETEIKEAGVFIQITTETTSPPSINVHLLRNNNPSLDIHKKIDGSAIFIEKEELKEGKYLLTVTWEEDEKTFQLKEELWIH